MNERAVAAEGLVVELGAARILDGLTLAAEGGAVLGVFGPSGAGKSTLFRALVGDERVTRGRVVLFGEDVTAEPLWRRARRGLGYVPQTPSVLFDLTIEENIRSFAAMAKGFDAKRARALADRFGLGERMRVRASELSGGERRKLELTRAFAAAPRLVVLDEPFAALDPAGKKVAGEVLREAAASGAAVVLSDHDVREALALCDRAALLLAGVVVCDEAPGAFAANAVVRTHYVALGS